MESEKEIEISDYVESYTNELADISARVQEVMREAQKRQKMNADQSRKAREHDFRPGELVMVRIDHWPGETYHKFRPKWSGPWRIVEIRGPVLTVKNLGNLEKIVKVNKEKAKKFIQNFEPLAALPTTTAEK